MGATTKHTYSGKSKISDSNDGVLAFPINPMTYPLHMPYGNGVKEALEAKAMVIKHRWYGSDGGSHITFRLHERDKWVSQSSCIWLL